MPDQPTPDEVLAPRQPSPADLTWLSQAAGIPQMVQALGQGAYDLFKLPQQALEASEQLRTTGEYNPKPVMEMASLLAGGGIPAAEEGALGVFGGKLAKTADLSKLAQAERYTLQGAKPLDVLRETGWFMGPDMRWRFEIPDTEAKLKRAQDIDWTRKTRKEGLPITEALQHQPVYEAYPGIKNAKVFYDQPPDEAMYFAQGGDESLHFDPLGRNPGLTGTAMHELQHAIQAREKFAPGASIPSSEVPVVANMWKSGHLVMDPKTKRLVTAPGYDPNTMKNFIDEMAYNTYFRHAGEAEARNVKDRYMAARSSAVGPAIYKTHPFRTMDLPPQYQHMLRNTDYVKALMK